MPTLYCREGEHEVKVGAERHAGESHCPEHPDCELRKPPRKQDTRAAFRSTVAYQRAAAHFKRVVCAERCYFADVTEADEPRRPGHRCRYPLDGHHLVPKDWILTNYGDLPPDELLHILFNPAIGAPLCRTAHDLVEYSSAPDACIYRDELSDECIEFCAWVDERYPDRPSMLEQLRRECPERQGVR